LQKEKYKLELKYLERKSRFPFRPSILVELEFGDAVFLVGGGKGGEPRGKPSEQGKKQQQTHAWVKLMGGDGSHHCVISVPQELPPILNIKFGRPQGWSQNKLQGLCSFMSHVVSILHAKDMYFPVFHSVLRYDIDEK